VSQVTDECEVVVLDTASIDNTEEVVARYMGKCPQLRYVKEPVARGFDQDRDRVIELSKGDYFWTVSSKDILKVGAVKAVLDALREDFSVILLNMEVTNLDQSSILLEKHSEIASNQIYFPQELSRLFAESFWLATHFSCAVMKREIWLSREKKRYHGSIGSHVGVLFQRPLPSRALIIATPMLRHRFGGQSWLQGATQMVLMWPSLVDSLAISVQTKAEFRAWMSQEKLAQWIGLRAIGLHSWSNYQKVTALNLFSSKGRLFALLAALLPGSLLNVYELARTTFSTNRFRYMHLEMLRASAFYFRRWKSYRFLVGLLGTR
jgi:glycosyltransferase involved in cell wall biosynthesis